jgi:SpoVK/Ycf46/Vps4 family AAA+-type ATPase
MVDSAHQEGESNGLTKWLSQLCVFLRFFFFLAIRVSRWLIDKLDGKDGHIERSHIRILDSNMPFCEHDMHGPRTTRKAPLQLIDCDRPKSGLCADREVVIEEIFAASSNVKHSQNTYNHSTANDSAMPVCTKRTETSANRSCKDNRHLEENTRRTWVSTTIRENIDRQNFLSNTTSVLSSSDRFRKAGNSSRAQDWLNEDTPLPTPSKEVLESWERAWREEERRAAKEEKVKQRKDHGSDGLTIFGLVSSGANNCDYTKRPRGGSLSAANRNRMSARSAGNQKHGESELTDMEKQIEAHILDHGKAITWDEIVGLEEAKRSLMEMVILPHINPYIFQGLRSPPRGLLLFGPPGNGKTYLAKAVAFQSRATFFNISASSLASKWYGDGEKLMEALFSLARRRAPSVIFFDEVDSLLSARGNNEHAAARRIKTEFLVQLDGCAAHAGANIVVLAATNRPMDLDEAVLRRLSKRIYVPLPDDNSRKHILANLLRPTPPTSGKTESASMYRAHDNATPRQNDCFTGAGASTTAPSDSDEVGAASCCDSTRSAGFSAVPCPRYLEKGISPLHFSKNVDDAKVNSDLRGERRNLSPEMSRKDIETVATWTEGYSASDLTALCREAALQALREVPLEDLQTLKPENLRGIWLQDFIVALKRIRKSVGEDGIQRLLKWQAEFGV